MLPTQVVSIVLTVAVTGFMVSLNVILMDEFRLTSVDASPGCTDDTSGAVESENVVVSNPAVV